MGRKSLHDFTLFLHADPPTAAAIKVSETGEEKQAFWLPRSQIEYEAGKEPGTIDVTIPEWLCIEKGLSGF